MPPKERQSRLDAVREHCTSHINMLKVEVEMMVDNPIFVPGHDGYFHNIEDKLAEMHEYMGILTVLDTYFEE